MENYCDPTQSFMRVDYAYKTGKTCGEVNIRASVGLRLPDSLLTNTSGGVSILSLASADIKKTA